MGVILGDVGGLGVQQDYFNRRNNGQGALGRDFGFWVGGGGSGKCLCPLCGMCGDVFVLCRVTVGQHAAGPAVTWH